MKCIDAVEGTVKCILKQLHSTHNQACSDDSEYIHQVKKVIGAIDQYVENNPELINDPSVLKQVLYVYSRNLWLAGQKNGDATTDSEDDRIVDNDDYHTYYYDYLYDKGVYPS
jgi:hypothetical protein